MKKVAYKSGLFNYDTLTVQFGGPLSNPENTFTATAIHVPPYKYTRREPECLGGGWYGGMETNEYTADKVYLIVRDGVCIGVMVHPYRQDIKTNLMPLTDKTDKPIMKFFKSLNLPYQHYCGKPLQPKSK